MLANVKGLVERLELSQAKAMMPLFEAISNSIDAIEVRLPAFSGYQGSGYAASLSRSSQAA